MNTSNAPEQAPQRGEQAECEFHFDSERARADEPMLVHFRLDHTPADAAHVGALFVDLAYEIVKRMPRSAERTVALRKLLESRDAAVRARLQYLETGR